MSNTPNHYCTYFDRGFLPQGEVLWQSLRRHDPQAVLWVLALDAEAVTALAGLRDDRLQVVDLAQLEAADPALVAAKANRSRIESYFTLSPCWPRWLLRTRPEISQLVYLDADLMFFSNPQPVWDELARGSVLFCAHRFPDSLRHFERHGQYNVGVLGWRRDASGLACLDWWRERCLEWCHDRIEPTRYADQKYLEEWPRRFAGVVACGHPGINLAPWNWAGCRLECGHDGVRVDGQSLVVFHFAALRRLGRHTWDPGQLDYGVMPASVRSAIYGPYFTALLAGAQERGAGSGVARRGRSWKRVLLLLVWGGLWWRSRAGRVVALGGLLPGRLSGRWLARWRGEGAGK